MLSADEAIAQARELKQLHQQERPQLDLIRRYWKGVQRLPAVIPSSAPREVRTMAGIARVNVCSIVVESLAQSTFVDNFRTRNADEELEVWNVWQRNKLDARQTGIHRAAFAYGRAYAVVTPGTPVPVIRGVSPRRLCAAYGDDPDWPEFALERRGRKSWRLYDADAVYELRQNNRGSELELVSASPHGADVTPVVRYLDEDDLDADDEVDADALAFMQRLRKPMLGQIAPLMPVQDQIDLTTFGLLTAQWYSAFRQRYILGWLASEEFKVNAPGAQIWSIDAETEGEGAVKVGEFDQTSLDGYIKSRESSLRHAAALSQTPAHELIGELVNLSAEALVAAEAGRDRKVDERETLLGESHEQTLRLAGRLAKIDVPDDAQVVWRETSARSFAATIDALGKMVKMLGVPPEEVWERIPGTTRQDVERWKLAAADRKEFGDLLEILAASVTGQPYGQPPGQ